VKQNIKENPVDYKFNLVEYARKSLAISAEEKSREESVLTKAKGDEEVMFDIKI